MLASAAASRGVFASTDNHAMRASPYAQVTPGYRLRFPQDEGSHPTFRIEWWYVTGWLQRAGAQLGFQITFFRVRPQVDETNPSAFTPRQIMVAHAALSDAKRGRLLHDQRAARAAFNLAGADEGRTRTWIDDWALVQDGSIYRARLLAREFGFDLELKPTQPPLLQGEDGLSRKGSQPQSASYYYSIPQLAAAGTLIEANRSAKVSGTAWLDHEWSSSYMDERAVGWDWIGINFEDESALMAFRMRGRNGHVLWAGGTLRNANGMRRVFAPEEIAFTPLRHWRSPRTGASYPVAWRVHAGPFHLTIEPLMDDQESDARLSTATVYWEGAVRALDNKKPVGRGYLELTGYWRPMKV